MLSKISAGGLLSYSVNNGLFDLILSPAATDERRIASCLGRYLVSHRYSGVNGVAIAVMNSRLPNNTSSIYSKGFGKFSKF